MPVLNIHHIPGPFAFSDAEDRVYIGRGGSFGNPFTHMANYTNAAIKVDTREEAVEAYRLWLTSDLEIPGWPKPTRSMVISLDGKDLYCWCAPKACHGDVLLELAEIWSKETKG